MVRTDLDPMLGDDAESIARMNTQLEGLDATARVEWALQHLPGRHLLSSSFGIQAAVMLHLVTRVAPGIPVVLVDTGHLFPETYQFIDELTARLGLNLHIYRAATSPAWQEARHGRLWEQGLEGISLYNRLNKVEPMQRALKELDVGTWFAGLRRSQADSRSGLSVLRVQDVRFKVHPVIDWNNRDVYRYLQHHNLPYHPLWEHGYVSVGDTHTSRPLEPGMHEQETRFFGLKRECGLHD
ncbi:MAG: phosphoadenylyl-sulfate reductase [Lamprocystis purpurea]|jgi:phosphoadenosine phosphosulfate reductase|uniref:phosphoadenylyl-sulfate reductase n=1 Tax=Lamprocystis purpurea TaxID=61598 RepID=UPI00036266E0|nr:phosphoadenylyl-sulfate reductase [Lamprocystis purpurea]MBV5273588.1 phosphoadenylyl-sulfate reductase [Lamprocystis purpurea]